MDFEVKSLKKKFKDKRFAAGVSRDVIRSGAEMLGWELDELFARTIEAMQSFAPDQATRSSLRKHSPAGVRAPHPHHSTVIRGALRAGAWPGQEGALYSPARPAHSGGQRRLSDNVRWPTASAGQRPTHRLSSERARTALRPPSLPARRFRMVPRLRLTNRYAASADDGDTSDMAVEQAAEAQHRLHHAPAASGPKPTPTSSRM